MNAEPGQMVPVSGWIGGCTLGVDDFWQPLAARAASDGVCRRFFHHLAQSSYKFGLETRDT
jgi:hypothetical protein